MANHNNIDISNILGGFNQENIGDIMNYLIQTLGSAGYEGFSGETFDLAMGGDNPWADIAWGSSGESGFSDWGAYSEGLEGVEGGMMGDTRLGSETGGFDDLFQELGAALSYIDPAGLQEQYTSGFSDLSGAYKSSMQNLKKAQRVGSKGGRYGSVALGGRGRKGGGRQKYMSDYYDLTNSYQSGISSLQEGIEGSFQDALLQYMTLYPENTGD